MTTKQGTSVVVVDAAEFVTALRCAALFAAGKDYPGVRVDVDEQSGSFEVTARMPNHITVTWGGLEWARFVDEDRDSAFELSFKQVRDILQVFKHYDRRPDPDTDEPPAQIGIHLTETEITWHDESGLMSVWLYGCARLLTGLAPAGKAIDAAIEETIAEAAVRLDQQQLSTLSRVAKVMDAPPTIRSIASGAGPVYRQVVTCGRFFSIATVVDTDATNGHDGLRLLEGVEDAEISVVAGPESTTRTLRVVSSNPTGGAV